MRTKSPEPLADRHEFDLFANGRHPDLDDWLKRRARSSEGLSSRTYVVCPEAEPNRVVGYHAISAASEQRAALPTAKLRSDMPKDVPLILVGRLAVDANWTARGIGYELLVDALRRSLAIAAIAGVRAVVAHAIDEDAARFYAKYGFLRSRLGERLMMMPLEIARKLIHELAE